MRKLLALSALFALLGLTSCNFGGDQTELDPNGVGMENTGENLDENTVNNGDENRGDDEFNTPPEVPDDM